MVSRRFARIRVGGRAVTALAAFAVFVGSGLAAPVPASAAGAIQCGSVITASVTLTADVGPCPGDGLVVTGSNITIDLGGHSVIGTFTQLAPMPPTNNSDGVGVHLMQASGVTVTDGTIYHFAAGVRLDGGSGNSITHLNVHDNIGDLGVDNADNGDGISLLASNNNLIAHNIVRHDGPWDGVALLSSDGGSGGTDGASYNTISYNVIQDNSVAMLDGSGQPSWKQDSGVDITGPGSTHNVVDHNVISGSSVNGVQVFPSCINSYGGILQGLGCDGTVSNDYNVISNNIVKSNGFGAPVAIAPVGDGIIILAMGPKGIFEPGHETIEGNVTSDNQRNGIALGGGNGQDLYNAPGTTGDNYGCGNIDSNGVNTGVPTADLCGTNSNTVSNNTSTGNGDDGIDIGPKSHDNVVTHNHVSNNHLDGIAAPLAPLFDSNGQAVPDGSGGFMTIAGTTATGNTIASNDASGDGEWDGRDDLAGCGNNWQGNHFVKVNQPCV